MRATACIVACSPPTASVLFWRRRLGRLSLSASFEWAEESLERHARDSDGDAAIEVLSVSCVLGLSLGSRAVWAIELLEKLGLRPP